MYQMLLGTPNYNRYLAPGAAAVPHNPATANRPSSRPVWASLGVGICLVLAALPVLSNLLAGAPAQVRPAGPTPTPTQVVLHGPAPLAAPTAGPPQAPAVLPTVMPTLVRRGPVPTLAPTPEPVPGSAIMRSVLH